MSIMYMFDMEPVDIDTLEGKIYQSLLFARECLDEQIEDALEKVLETRYGKIGAKTHL